MSGVLDDKFTVWVFYFGLGKEFWDNNSHGFGSAHSSNLTMYGFTVLYVWPG